MVKIIAEIGVNDNGCRDRAERGIIAAKDSGADAVKIQIFRTGEMVTRLAGKATYQDRSGESAENQYENVRTSTSDLVTVGEQVFDTTDRRPIVFIGHLHKLLAV